MSNEFDPNKRDMLYKTEADYKGMSKGVLEAYWQAAIRFKDELAKSRIKREMDKLEAAENLKRKRADDELEALIGDNSWKKKDTFGIGNTNVKYVIQGGYKEYSDALAKQKEKDGNRGSPIKGDVQWTLLGEIYYLGGQLSRAKYRSDAAIDEINRIYDLPC